MLENIIRPIKVRKLKKSVEISERYNNLNPSNWHNKKIHIKYFSTAKKQYDLPKAHWS
jgi:hypothetical protein